MALHTISLRWGLCVVAECTPKDDAHQVYAIHVHHSHTDRVALDAVRVATAILTWFCITPRPRTCSTGVGMLHRPLLKAATYYRYIVPNMQLSVDMSMSAHWSAEHGCILEWMLQTLFTSQSTTVTICRVKTEGAIRSPMTVTNESLKLQPLSMHITYVLYPGANEHSKLLEGVIYFFFLRQCINF